MKICFPVEQANGLESTVYGHFGSAPAFVIIDTERANDVTVANANRVHEHGACNPIMAMGGASVDAVVVGGIGAGAIGKLNGLGVRVFRAAAGTVRENLSLFSAGSLPEMTVDHACGGHAHGGGCSHR
jgi:predicted Fe-Mo cluster-binding NifX family protein